MTINRASITLERSKRQKAEARVLQLEAMGRRVIQTAGSDEHQAALELLGRLLEKPRKADE